MSSKTLRLRDKLAVRVGDNVDSAEYLTWVSEVLRTAIPFDYACLATTDPASGLITHAVKSDPRISFDNEFAHFEYQVDDYNQFADLARRPVPVGVLEFDTDGHPDRSPRYRDLLRNHMSLGHELRATFRSGNKTWGLLGLYREVGARGFSTEEADFAAAGIEVIAAGIRRTLLAQPSRRDDHSPTGPAVLVVGADGSVRSSTDAADHLIAQLGADHHRTLPMPLLAVVASALNSPQGSAMARLRALDGSWLVASAGRLSGNNTGDEMVLTLRQAGPPEVIPLVVAALGLSPREKDVVQLVLQGADTSAIAKRLYLSPHTVQDHLKSVFRKAGVRSRKELAATVFFEHHAPRLGSG